MSRGGGGRDRFHSEYSPRVDEKERRSGWGIAPPSRHLWVGNLSQHVTQNMLSEQFLRFGDLDNISYIPGRSFAFVNFRKEEDAIIALRGLQGFSVAGMPLRIEFAKGAAEALGAIGLESIVPLLEQSLVSDPALEVRETCELALRRIKGQQNITSGDGTSAAAVSPFSFVDPAMPTSLFSSIDQLRLPMFKANCKIKLLLLHCLRSLEMRMSTHWLDMKLLKLLVPLQMLSGIAERMSRRH